MSDDEPAVRPLDPDDVGTGEVQDSGLLYVGREYAGEAVRWAMEVQEDGE